MDYTYKSSCFLINGLGTENLIQNDVILSGCRRQPTTFPPTATFKRKEGIYCTYQIVKKNSVLLIAEKYVKLEKS